MSERINKINSLIQRALSDIILLEHHHPSFKMITITRVETSVDLSYTDVYVTSFENQEDLIKYLTKIKPVIQKKLTQKISLRRTPKVKFKIDDTADFIKNIDRLIKKNQTNN